jgi:hypothetical protein
MVSEATYQEKDVKIRCQMVKGLVNVSFPNKRLSLINNVYCKLFQMVRLVLLDFKQVGSLAWARGLAYNLLVKASIFLSYSKGTKLSW